MSELEQLATQLGYDAMEELRLAVKRGAQVLDTRDDRDYEAAIIDDPFMETWGPSWWETIDLSTLDLGSACHCVLGQLGGYVEMVKELLRDEEFGMGFNDIDAWAIHHGFERPYRCEPSYLGYRALELLWREQVVQRRGA